MKTFLPLITAVAFAAFVALPFAAEIVISLSFTASLASIFAADYGRRLNPLPLHRSSGRHGGRPSIPEGEPKSVSSARERLRLAA